MTDTFLLVFAKHTAGEDMYYVQHQASKRYYYRCFVRRSDCERILEAVRDTFDDVTLRNNFQTNRFDCHVS